MAPAIRLRKTSCRFSCRSVWPLFVHRAWAESRTVHDGVWVLGGNYYVNSEVFHTSVSLTKPFSMPWYRRLQKSGWGFRKTLDGYPLQPRPNGVPCAVFLFWCILWRAAHGLEAFSTRKECLISMEAVQELRRPSSLATKLSQLFLINAREDLGFPHPL